MRALIAILFVLGSLPAAAPPASQDRARTLVERVIANQHRNDRALYDYERVERRVSYRDNSVASDETYRLVPTGTGRLSLLVKRGDRPVSLDYYQKELRDWREVLRHAVDPNDPRELHSKQVQERSDRKRAELIDAIGRAFHFTWLGEEEVNGRKLAHIALDPDPSFQPTTRETEMLRHVRANAWIDVEAGQLVRGRADIMSDISAGGGLAGKIYSGGWFKIEQTEAAPGVWLPARTEYSIRGRMFLFSFTEHKLQASSRYRYIGAARQALEVARRDIASGKFFPGDP
ncbi:MAG: hypothetical protein KGL59_11290 [Acidobacteriota bacterium]|nr:hypothetical protein [Acidobacteriota bacterium]